MTGSVGPGQYRTDCHFPEDKDGVQEWRRWPNRRTGFGIESRTAHDGVLKGMSTSANNKRTNPLGPGQYDVPETAVWKSAPTLPTFDRSVEAPEELRVRKSREAVPGPGAYALRSDLEEAGRELQRATESLPRSSKRCQWTSQFNHIFKVLKPKTRADVRPCY